MLIPCRRPRLGCEEISFILQGESQSNHPLPKLSISTYAKFNSNYATVDLQKALNLFSGRRTLYRYLHGYVQLLEPAYHFSS